MSWQPCHEPECEAQPNDVGLVIEPTARDLGGFSVRRVLPSGRRRMVGPFIFFDHMGPAKFEPGRGIDVRPHPHIGIATVTYLFEGRILHRDNLGCVQPIDAGALNWMTAGRGIVHSERSDPEERARGPRLHGIQSWVALPRDLEEIEPSFDHYPAYALPTIERDGATMRVVAGEAYGELSPATTLSPLYYVDATLRAESEIRLPNAYPEHAVYVVEGEVTVAGRCLQGGRMIVLGGAADAVMRARSDSRMMLLGGAPLEEERYIWWNFVSSSQARIERAKDDWKNGRFEPVPADDDFMPLPER